MLLKVLRANKPTANTNIKLPVFVVGVLERYDDCHLLA